MPNITSIDLNLQHGGADTSMAAQRTARVVFTTNFNQVEILSGTVFKADVKLVSKDSMNDDRILAIGTTFVQASNVPVQITLNQVFTRANLDEDADSIRRYGGGIRVYEDVDEWLARVTLSPAIFETVTANSLLVNGSWGSQGHD
jgi:hypothetical protein